MECYRIYVGNYPTEFTKEDVQNLFKELDGFTVEKMCKKDKKCFSFCFCTDIDQLVETMKSKNNSLVCGRRLKIRGVEKGLQEYLELLIKYDENSSYVESTLPSEVKQNFIEQNCNDSDGKYIPTQMYVQLKCQPYNEQSPTIVPSQAQVVMNKQPLECFTKDFEHWPLDESSANNEAKKSFYAPLRGMTNQKCESNVKIFGSSPTETINITTSDDSNYAASTSYHQTSSYVGSSESNITTTNASTYSASTRNPTQTASFEPIWVSFTNFPFGTTKDEIYDLFSDFCPLDVLMIHNRPTKQRSKLSEAYVCFSNEDVATDVIMNYDNTLFNNRRVFVTDIDGYAINEELLAFNFKS